MRLYHWWATILEVEKAKSAREAQNIILFGGPNYTLENDF